MPRTQRIQNCSNESIAEEVLWLAVAVLSRSLGFGTDQGEGCRVVAIRLVLLRSKASCIQKPPKDEFRTDTQALGQRLDPVTVVPGICRPLIVANRRQHGVGQQYEACEGVSCSFSPRCA